MDTESLSLDLDVLLYTIRSSKEDIDYKIIEKEVQNTKFRLKEINPLFLVLESYFMRNNTPKDIRNVYYQNELDFCLNKLRFMTADIVKCHQSLNYPIPDWLMSQVIMKDEVVDEELQFEIKLFNWISNVKDKQEDLDKLVELKKLEGFNDLNLKIPPNHTLHGFLTFDSIIEDWKYKDMRMHRKIDTLVKKEWINLLDRLTVKVEFMTGKIGIILVSSKKQN